MPRDSVLSPPNSDRNPPTACAVPVVSATPGRASWSSIVRLFQVVIPVKAYSLVASRDDGGLHQLHAVCGQRIRQQKLCPVHGPVESSEIVNGYEYASNQHVVLDNSDLEALRPANDKAVILDRFLPQGQIDPVLYSGRSFMLLPDGPTAQRPYALLMESLRRQQKWAVGRTVLYNHRHPILVRPGGKVLALDVLHDPAQIKGAPETSLSSVAIAKEELALAGALLNSATTPIRWSDYRDDTVERFTALVEAKLKGGEVTAPPQKELAVLPLLEALQQSVAAGFGTRPTSANHRPRKKSPPKSASR